MLPEYIHMRVAESILFAGKAIRVLRNPSPGATLQEPFNQSQNSKGSHRMQSFIGGSGALKELPNFCNISAEELLPQAEADKIDAMLKELKVSSQPLLAMFILSPLMYYAHFLVLLNMTFYLTYLFKDQY